MKHKINQKVRKHGKGIVVSIPRYFLKSGLINENSIIESIMVKEK